jgi:hypothetical protein
MIGIVLVLGLAGFGYFIFRPKPQAAARQDLDWAITPQAPPSEKSVALTNFPESSSGGRTSPEAGWNPDPRNDFGTTDTHPDINVGKDFKGAAPDTGAAAGLVERGSVNGQVNFGSGVRRLAVYTMTPGVFFESVKFILIQDKKGLTHLVGDVVIQNDMFKPLSGATLTLQVSGLKFPLRPYEGSVNSPKWLPGFNINSRESASCHVIAEGFQPWGPLGGDKYVAVDGTVAGEPVHSQAEIRENAPEPAN